MDTAILHTTSDSTLSVLTYIKCENTQPSWPCQELLKAMGLDGNLLPPYIYIYICELHIVVHALRAKYEFKQQSTSMNNRTRRADRTGWLSSWMGSSTSPADMAKPRLAWETPPNVKRIDKL